MEPPCCLRMAFKSDTTRPKSWYYIDISPISDWGDQHEAARVHYVSRRRRRGDCLADYGARTIDRGAAIMFRHLASVGLFATLMLTAPALAITAQQKMETCKFGADDQRLAGAERKNFISRCMANEASPAKRAKTQPKKGTSEATPTR